jgi:endoglucanase
MLRRSYFAHCVCLLLELCVGQAQTLVRLNQVGVVQGKPLRACVMSSSNQLGASWQLRTGGGIVVASGTLSSSIGAWSSSFPFVHNVSLNTHQLQRGNYSLLVKNINNSSSVQSPMFVVQASSAELYSHVVANAVFFFQAQRDGRDVISSVMGRKPSHLVDATATVYIPAVYDDNNVLMGHLTAVDGAGPFDAEGGWADAGDYLKFVQTASYTAVMLLTSLRDAPSIQRVGDFQGEALHGLQWLLKMWDDTSRTLYYQVSQLLFRSSRLKQLVLRLFPRSQVGLGDGNDQILADHDLWRLPERDDALNVHVGDDKYFVKYRPVFRAAPANSSVSPNLAGRLAAAFALG